MNLSDKLFIEFLKGLTPEQTENYFEKDESLIIFDLWDKFEKEFQ